MSRQSTLPSSYFETKYQNNIDPWHFRTSPYEREKYEATFGALTKRRYRIALEAGCSIGVFSALLARCCKQLIAIDASKTAIAEARRQDLPNARFETAVLPDEFPERTFDLIVLSEVLYYFSTVDLEELAAKCVSAVERGGEIILCHWLGETDYPLTGQEASDLFAEEVASRRPTRVILHEGIYRLERLSFAS